MPQFANVMQSNAFDTRPEQYGERNMFDLSHDHKTSFHMGWLVPFLAMETLPGDTWYIRGDYMLRFAPLYLPIMHRVNISVDYFYCPNRILWPGTSQDSWEFFITSVDSVQSPYVTLVAGNHSFESIMCYMGLPSQIEAGVPTADSISALPLSAYLKIYDEYYRNDQIQGVKWFELASGNNAAGFVAALGATYPPLYRNWPRDYYTSSTLTPQIGNDTLIPLVSEYDPTATTALPTYWRSLTDGGAAAQGNVVIGATGRSEDVSPDFIGLDIQETAGTIRELRYSLMLTEFLERMLRAGDRYRDVQKAFWGVDPQPNTVDRPQYIGGRKGRVVVSDVLSTADTVDADVPPNIIGTLGSYAGQALALESTDGTLEHFCSEHGIILGIMSVYPNSSYMQGKHRMWWKRNDRLDYPWPQFALIGDDAVQNQEVLWDITGVATDPDWNTQTFGYNQRYAEWRYMNDIYSGQMRDAAQPWFSFHFGRLLDGANPDLMVLDGTFLECRPDITRVFQIANDGEHEVYAHIYNDIKVRRMLPKFGIPAV